jgi:hypothetical protein
MSVALFDAPRPLSYSHTHTINHFMAHPMRRGHILSRTPSGSLGAGIARLKAGNTPLAFGYVGNSFAPVLNGISTRISLGGRGDARARFLPSRPSPAKGATLATISGLIVNFGEQGRRRTRSEPPSWGRMPHINPVSKGSPAVHRHDCTLGEMNTSQHRCAGAAR